MNIQFKIKNHTPLLCFRNLLVSVFLAGIFLAHNNPLFAESFNPNVVTGKVEVVEINDDKIFTQILTQYQAISRRPTDAERTVMASASEIQTSVSNFNDWAKRILNPKWLPPTNTSVFGLKKWQDNGDVLFAEYSVDGNVFEVRDTPTDFIVTITADNIGDHSDDWGKYFRTLSSTYLVASKRLAAFSLLYVAQCNTSSVTRLGVTLPFDSRLLKSDFGLLESVVPSTFWINGKSVTIVTGKATAGGWQVQGDYESGVRQRFPSLATILEGFTIDGLIDYLAGDRYPQEQSVAESLIRKKADTNTVPKLIQAYQRLNSTEIRMALVQMLGEMAEKFGKPTSTLTLELVQKELAAQTNHIIFRSVLLNVSNRVMKTTSNSRPDETPK
jgi:hypothetical protein